MTATATRVTTSRVKTCVRAPEASRSAQSAHGCSRYRGEGSNRPLTPSFSRRKSTMSHRRAPAVRHDAPGMKGQRSRNQDGELRQKRGDTHARTIEEQYHVDLRSEERRVGTERQSRC